mmetsp:Transcript_23728/g.72730  ORF Transcript_23728/g.72730 Transcript_23728/m.72730 type:complete len:86 (-) Transcript_23728:114-371(-)
MVRQSWPNCIRKTASKAADRCAGAGTPCAPPAAVAAFCLVSSLGGPAGPIGRFEAMALQRAVVLGTRSRVASCRRAPLSVLQAVS